MSVGVNPALLPELAVLFAASADVVPTVDCCRPYGVRVDRSRLPADDAVTDLRARIAVWEPREMPR